MYATMRLRKTGIRSWVQSRRGRGITTSTDANPAIHGRGKARIDQGNEKFGGQEAMVILDRVFFKRVFSAR